MPNDQRDFRERTSLGHGSMFFTNDPATITIGS